MPEQSNEILSEISEKLDTLIALTRIVLSKQVADELAIAEITVKKKIAELKDMGLLKTVKKGREAYYEKSGLVD
jgi:Mn-dependent DtxR family transcriptional regulator